MLELGHLNCKDCVTVLHHVLNRQFDVHKYELFVDNGIVRFTDPLSSEVVERIKSALRSSGIISSEKHGATDSPPAKRSRLLSDDVAYTTRINQLTVVIEPANWCSRGHHVPAWCLHVSVSSTLSHCLAVLGRLRPLPADTLGHLKRVHVVKSATNTRVSRVLLDLATSSFSETDASILASEVIQQIPAMSGSTVRPCWIPLTPIRSCCQHTSLSAQCKVLSFNEDGEVSGHGWPSNFHPNAHLESLLAVGDTSGIRSISEAIPYFSDEDICWHNRWLQRAVELVEVPNDQQRNKNASCDPMNPLQVCSCIILPPPAKSETRHHDVEPLVEAVSTAGDSCIDHASMIAANTVGRLNLKAKPLGESGYLCTGCDAYLAVEPCIMCAMALLHSRIGRIFVARRLPSLGGLASRWKISLVPALNHHFLVFVPAHD